MSNNTFLPAGSHRKTPAMELWSLSPLPLPTGYPVVPHQLDLKKASATTLDHGQTDYGNFEFGTRASLGMCFSFFLVLFLMHIVLLFTSLDYYSSFIEALYFESKAMLPIYIYIVGGVFLFFLILSVFVYFKQSNQVPLRFNREKREVYAVAGAQTIVAPWESIHIQVDETLLVTAYGAIQQSSITFQIPDQTTQQVATFNMPYPTMELAIAEWEAIRVFMEQGLDTLKQQAQTSKKLTPDELTKLEQNPQPTMEYYEKLAEQYPLGSVKAFYAVKNQHKYNPHKPLGHIIWIILHLCSGWTLPCYISQWLNRHPYIKRPKAMLEWSKPIPQEQWAKPSTELVNQSNQLLGAYGKKGINNIRDYFTKNKELQA